MPASRYNHETEIGGTELIIKYSLYLNDDGPKIKAKMKRLGTSTSSRHLDSTEVDPKDLPKPVQRHFSGQLAAARDSVLCRG